MWLLLPENEAEGAEQMRLLAGCQHTVGRQNCDFLITNDKSISRCHATLSIAHSETDVAHPHKIPVLKIKDESKFGTEIHGERFNKEERIVKSGTKVKFGTVSSTYRAVYEPYVVSTSCLNQAPKKQTKTLLAQLGGHVVSDWRPECQLLVMSNLSVTVKVICALVSLKSIVTVQYLEAMIKAVKAKTAMPDPNNFTPPLAESQLNPAEVSFREDERRKTLLQDKVFIFLNPIQFKKLNLAVGLAGGKPVLMEEGTDDNKDDILVEPSSCVMFCDPTDPTHQLSENAQEWIQHVFTVLSKKGRRPIPDCELGYAVLYCSTERYCNPSISASSGQYGTLPSQSISQMVPPSLSQQVNVPIEPDRPIPNKPSASAAHTTSQNGHNTRNESRKSIKAEVVAPAATEVKEEPLSQSEAPTPVEAKTNPDNMAASTISSFLNRKRKKDSTTDQSTSKSAKNMGDVKEEPVTPKKVETTMSKTAERRVSPRRSPDPAGGGVGSHRREHSPSPRVETVASKRPKVEESEEEEEEDIFEVYKRKTKPRSRSPEPRSKVRDSPSTGGNQDSAKHKLNNGVRGDAPSDRAKVAGEMEWSESETDDLRDVKDIKRPAASPGSPASPASPECPSKTEPVAILEDEEDDMAPQGVGHEGDGDVPAGFLRAGRPRQQQGVGPFGDGHVSDPDIPKDAGMVTVVKALVTRKSGCPSRVPAENNNNVNGNHVKNFKKFKKVLPAGATGLPRIIGGSDLAVHASTQCKEVEDWMNEERIEESQQNEVERIAEEIFRYVPPSNKRGSKR